MKLREAAKQALEAMEKNTKHLPLHFDNYFEAMNALRAALAQPEQEPVAWMRPDNRVAEESVTGKQFNRGPKEPPIGTWVPLYTAPPQRKPLTQAQVYAAIKGIDSLKAVDVARAVERAHGIGGSNE